MDRNRFEPIGIGAVALAFGVALPFSIASPRIGLAVFVLMLGVAFLRATRREIQADQPLPPPIPLRRGRPGPPRPRPGSNPPEGARRPGRDVER